MGTVHRAKQIRWESHCHAGHSSRTLRPVVFDDQWLIVYAARTSGAASTGLITVTLELACTFEVVLKLAC